MPPPTTPPPCTKGPSLPATTPAPMANTMPSSFAASVRIVSSPLMWMPLRYVLTCGEQHTAVVSMFEFQWPLGVDAVQKLVPIQKATGTCRLSQASPLQMPCMSGT